MLCQEGKRGMNHLIPLVGLGYAEGVVPIPQSHETWLIEWLKARSILPAVRAASQSELVFGAPG